MITPELAAEISQEHESWLNELEGLAIEAIATHDWAAFYAHVVDFQCEHDLHGDSLIAIGDDEANTAVIGDGSGAGFVQNTNDRTF